MICCITNNNDCKKCKVYVKIFCCNIFNFCVRYSLPIPTFMTQYKVHAGLIRSVDYNVYLYLSSAARNPDRAMLNGQTSHGVDILKIHHDSSQQFTSQVSDKLNVKVKHGFGAWLQSRKETTDDPDQHANGTQHRETYSAGLDQNGSRILQEEKSYMSSSSLQSSSRSHPLSPAEFDSLADSIASRVKKDLGIKHSSVADRVNGRHHEQMEMREGSFKGPVFVQEERPGVEQSAHRTGDSDGDGEGSVDVSSHRCPFCSTLMVSWGCVKILF